MQPKCSQNSVPSSAYRLKSFQFCFILALNNICTNQVPGTKSIKTLPRVNQNNRFDKHSPLQITEYSDRCMKACQILAQLFALALGLEQNYFEPFFDHPTCMLGMNYYHFPTAKLWQDENDPFGVKPHLDSGIFTLLLTDGSEGLERCINRKVRKTLFYQNEMTPIRPTTRFKAVANNFPQVQTYIFESNMAVENSVAVGVK